MEGGGRERRAIADSHRGRKGLPSSESSPSQHPLSQKCLEKPIKILFLPLPPSSTSFIRSAPNPFPPSAHATNPFLHCHSSPALDLPPQPTPGKSRKQRWAPNLLSLLLSPPSRYISSRNYLLFSESSEHERGSKQEGGGTIAKLLRLPALPPAYLGSVSSFSIPSKEAEKKLSTSKNSSGKGAKKTPFLFMQNRMASHF